MSPPRVVLVLIVKNEAAVIERCLTSARPLIDAWCIVDTGSTDDTRERVCRTLADLPGRLIDEPWRDFAYNRNVALAGAAEYGDYAFMIDADEQIEVDPGFDPTAWKSSLTADVYEVTILRSELSYTRPQITSTALPFNYRGVLHEFLDIPAGAVHGGVCTGFANRSHYDGARSTDPDKYLRDAQLLEAELRSGADPDLVSRYTFYCAQSYRDAGERAKAVEYYERRTRMGGWAEEVSLSYLSIGHILQTFDAPVDRVIDAYLRAHDASPDRAEPFVYAAAAARTAGRLPTAYLFAKEAVARPTPPTALFVEQDIYAWRAKYELSVAAYYAGRWDEGRAACEAVLATPGVPDAEREATVHNLHLYTA